MFRVFRYRAAPQDGALRRPPVSGVYEWVGDASGFAEGNQFRPTGMSKIESAIRDWFRLNAPVDAGCYVAAAWGHEDESPGVPIMFTVKAQELQI